MERKKNKQQKFHIRKGDTVKVIAGNAKGKTGKVLEMFGEKDRALVEGANVVTKHKKPSANSPQGGIDKVEAPIHISNLMLVDPKTGDATRTGRKQENKGWVRVSKKSNEVIN